MKVKVIRCEPEELENKINAQLKFAEGEVIIIPLPTNMATKVSVILQFKAKGEVK